MDHFKAAEVALAVLQRAVWPQAQEQAKRLLEASMTAILAEYDTKGRKP